MGLDLFDLSGKIGVVTGGARGIGRAIAEGLAEAGASLVVADIEVDGARDTCRQIEKLGVRAKAVSCDVSRSDHACETVRAAMEEFGHLDILVNNAGISGSAKPIVDMPDDEWHRTLDVNLSGIFYCFRAAAREMIKQKNGKIINILSIGAFQPVRHSADYCASKGGGLLLTKVLALELIQHNIHVNAMCPGAFDTNLAPALKESVIKHIKNLIPIGRIADVKEIKGLAVFLASAASDYLVGSAISIDGGGSIRG